MPTPWPNGRPSWNCLSARGRWRTTTWPLLLRRVSLNSARPSAAASVRCSYGVGRVGRALRPASFRRIEAMVGDFLRRSTGPAAAVLQRPARRRPTRQAPSSGAPPDRQPRGACAHASAAHCRTAGVGHDGVEGHLVGALRAVWMASLISHQPVMLNFMPSSR